MIPALFTRIFTTPKVFSIFLNADSTELLFETSQPIAVTLPSALISSCFRASSFSTRRARAITLIPAFAKSRTIAAPIPLKSIWVKSDRIFEIFSNTSWSSCYNGSFSTPLFHFFRSFEIQKDEKYSSRAENKLSRIRFHAQLIKCWNKIFINHHMLRERTKISGFAKWLNW